jgi:FdhD protein
MSAAEAVAEASFWLEINGRRIGSWTCSPGDLPALIAGWLLAQGYLDPLRRPPSLEVVEDDGILGVRAILPVEQVLQGDLERRHRREHGCGLLYFVRCAPERVRRRASTPPSAPPTREELLPLFRALFAASTRDRDLGGLHTAALTDGERILYQIDEVGRHNAVDKVIGRAILEGVDPGGLGLLTTARISGEIALKAARARLAWVASRSVPTTLALDIARIAQLPLLARAIGREPRLHAPAEGGLG